MVKDKEIYVVNVKKNKQIRMIMEDFNIDVVEAEVLILTFQKDAGAMATDDNNAIRACKMLKLHNLKRGLKHLERPGKVLI